MIDWTRQFLANLSHKFYHNVVEAFQKKDGDSFRENRSKFELLLGDMGLKSMHLATATDISFQFSLKHCKK